MKMFIKRSGLMLVLAWCMLTTASAFAADKGNFSTKPTMNNGQKWRIGYYEGGEYIDYQKNLIAMVKGLMELGWIETIEIPVQQGEQTKDLWQWLVTTSKSRYLEFVPDAYYTANWDDSIGKNLAAAIIERLNTTKDIDLIIAMGTWAGQALANNNHHTPVIVASTSNPISSNIIKSVEDSGYDHVLARVDPLRYERQVRIFHDIIGFQKLGVAYEDTVRGHSIAALTEIERIAQERGFETVSCLTIDDVPDKAIAEESVKKCFQELGDKGVNAIYATLQNGINTHSIPELVKIVNSYRIPTFSQSGSDEVRYGFLMSISTASFKYVGVFYAETIAKIFNGAQPRQLGQLFEDPPKIAINLKTAESIGYDPPVDVLGAADEIYQEIETPK